MSDTNNAILVKVLEMAFFAAKVLIQELVHNHNTFLVEFTAKPKLWKI